MMSSEYIKFPWRLLRNILAVTPARRFVFERAALAEAFSTPNPEYAVTVYRGHRERLTSASAPAGFERILEIGPGTALGVSLLFWAESVVLGIRDPELVLWDMYPNMQLSDALIRDTAQGVSLILEDKNLRQLLREVAVSQKRPRLTYEIGQVADLWRLSSQSFGLVYSHAALEHIWEIRDCWRAVAALSSIDSWHSHHIDLKDHGNRDNYLAMCEWGSIAYWCTMRFIPGAINRERACQHFSLLEHLGFNIVLVRRDCAEKLPTERHRLAAPFTNMSDEELRTRSVSFVAKVQRNTCR